MQIGVQLVAADLAINGAAFEIGRQLLRRPSDGAVQIAGNIQYRVANLFRIHPFAIRSPVKPVTGILFEIQFVVFGAQLVSGAEHDFALQLFNGHAIFDKAAGQVLEQFRIGGPLAAETEITGRIHDAGAKLAFPDSIHDNPHGDGLVHDQIRQLHAAAAIGERYRIALGQDAQKMPRHFRPEGFRIAANR